MRTEKKSLDTNDYSEATVIAKRKMPVRNIALIAIIVIAQIALVVFGVVMHNTEYTPIDVIKEYNVTVRPQDDGTLNIEYDILWEALSDSEPLTWVDIGIPNLHASIVDYSLSDTVKSAKIVREGGGDFVRLYFKDSYEYGETVRFGFEINQREMLTVSSDEYLYELVPGWFNEIPVEKYCFRWKNYTGEEQLSGGSYDTVDGYYVFEGNLQPGEYFLMRVNYPLDTFADPDVVSYAPFDDSGAYNELKDDGAILAITILFAVILIIPEVYIIDSFVSYGRGRGFICE